MDSLKRNWTLYVIHHSHTDIGYTDRQEKIFRYQTDYVRQAVEIIEKARSGERPEWQGFKWTCETFWAVELFWEQASSQMRERFIRCLRSGDIGLSGTYLNLTELPDEQLLQSVLRRSTRFGREAGVVVDSAMNADINGYGWGYAQCLADAGIEHLFTCIHTHHGMFPLGRKQIPFWWETPKGDRLLVWNGEHYNFGNVLGLAPGALSNYLVNDEFQASAIDDRHWEIAETRIGRYLGQLEKEGYPYDFVPVAVSGLMTDNAPPNGGVMAFIRQWNEKHGRRVRLEMTTLSPFFRHLKAQDADIPVYRGDWPDWWSDGVISTAMHTQIYRDAQRTLRLVKRLDPDGRIAVPSQIREIENQLILYAEHTWGYDSSVSEPWNRNVQALEVRKMAYAAQGHRLVYTALDRILGERGEAPLAAERPLHYRILNPHPTFVREYVSIPVPQYEKPLLRDGYSVIDEADGREVPCQTEHGEGRHIVLSVALQPGEEKTVSIVPAGRTEERTVRNFSLVGSEGIHDLQDFVPSGVPAVRVKETWIESPFVRIGWERDNGIVSWLDKTTGRDLLRCDRKHGAFTPIYERTPTPACAMVFDRKAMGRNRKGFHVQRSAGRLTGKRSVAEGPLYATVELRYDMEGVRHFALELTVFADNPRVGVKVRFLKESGWEPENVYLYLPFGEGPGGKTRLWIEKAGALVEPGVDQLPGTCIDYYCIQEGVAFASGDSGIAIAMPDTPLVQLGPLEFGQRMLHGQQGSGPNHGHLYSWVLSNYWETNFKATLGGFYEFRYAIEWGPHLQSPAAAMACCHVRNLGCIGFRTGGK